MEEDWKSRSSASKTSPAPRTLNSTALPTSGKKVCLDTKFESSVVPSRVCSHMLAKATSSLPLAFPDIFCNVILIFTALGSFIKTVVHHFWSSASQLRFSYSCFQVLHFLSLISFFMSARCVIISKWQFQWRQTSHLER